MVGKTKTPTKAEKDRMTVLKEHVPCIPCLMVVRKVRLPSIQHTVSGMTRDGHLSTYSACDWHHFGYVQDGMDKMQMMGLLGPSLAHGKRGYQEHFGNEKLLVRLANFFVDEFQKSPWMDYMVPYELQRRAFNYWSENR